MADAFIEYCFREFVKEIGEIVTEHYDTNLNFRSPTVDYSTGGKYWKVFKNYNKGLITNKQRYKKSIKKTNIQRN